MLHEPNFQTFIKEKLQNTQGVQDFVDSSTLEENSTSPLQQEVHKANIIADPKRRDEILNSLKLRQEALLQLKEFLFDKLINTDSLQTLEKMRKDIFLLQARLKEDEHVKKLFLKLIQQKIQAKTKCIQDKQRVSDLYMIGVGVATVLSNGCNGAASQFPFLAFILKPMGEGLNFLSFYFWLKSIEKDTTVSQEEKEIIRKKLEDIRLNNGLSSIMGMWGGLFLFVSAAVPAIAPVTLTFGMSCIAISNILLTVAFVKDLIKEIKLGKKDFGRSARIASGVFFISYSLSNTIGSVLLLTAAILALAFPPTAMAIAGAFAITGMVFIGITVAGFVAGKISAAIAEKKVNAEKESTKAQDQEVTHKLGIEPPEVHEDPKAHEDLQNSLSLEKVSKSKTTVKISKRVEEIQKMQNKLDQMNLDAESVIKQSNVVQGELRIQQAEKQAKFIKHRDGLEKDIEHEKNLIKEKEEELTRLIESHEQYNAEMNKLQTGLKKAPQESDAHHKLLMLQEQSKQNHINFENKKLRIEKLISSRQKTLHLKEAELKMLIEAYKSDIDEIEKLQAQLRQIIIDVQVTGNQSNIVKANLRRVEEIEVNLRKSSTMHSTHMQSITFVYDTNHPEDSLHGAPLSTSFIEKGNAEHPKDRHKHPSKQHSKQSDT